MTEKDVLLVSILVMSNIKFNLEIPTPKLKWWQYGLILVIIIVVVKDDVSLSEIFKFFEFKINNSP